MRTLLRARLLFATSADGPINAKLLSMTVGRVLISPNKPFPYKSASYLSYHSITSSIFCNLSPLRLPGRLLQSHYKECPKRQSKAINTATLIAMDMGMDMVMDTVTTTRAICGQAKSTSRDQACEFPIPECFASSRLERRLTILRQETAVISHDSIVYALGQAGIGRDEMSRMDVLEIGSGMSLAY
jgi:hypothetical protein